MMEHQFHWRRIPGTLALALTNLIAGMLLLDQEQFMSNPFTAWAADYLPAWFIGGGFLLAGLVLLWSTIHRRWKILNFGSAMSLWLWVFMSVGIFLAGAPLTPIAYAMLFWMVVGQASMLFAPLWAKGRGYE